MKPGRESRPEHRPLLVPSRDFSRSGEIMVWDRVVSTAQKSQNGRRVRTTPIKAGWFDNILVFVHVEGDAKMGQSVRRRGYIEGANVDGYHWTCHMQLFPIFESIPGFIRTVASVPLQPLHGTVLAR